MNIRNALLLAFCAAATPLSAAPADSLALRYRDQLKALEDNRLNEDRTRAEGERARKDALTLREQLIANAEKIQVIEAALAETEADLPELNLKLSALEADFERDRAKVASLLAVLQRLDADIPPALVVKPEDSLAAARGAMQLGAVLPVLHTQAAALSKQLKTLEEARANVAAKVAEQQSQAQALRNAREELSRLLELRRKEQETAAQKLVELHGIAEQIAKRTSDLKGLMARIAQLRNTPAAQNRIVGTEDSQPKVAALRVPVTGRSEPGDPSGPFTGNAQKKVGLWFESASGSQAVAPADSQVVFAGPYQNFGQVLILEMNGGYHLTLAGLGRIDVRIGDRVLAGEPVGALANGLPSRLYLELRRNGQIMDPAPWLGAELRKAKGT